MSENQTERHLPRSWLARLSPYIRMLEFLVDEYRQQRDEAIRQRDEAINRIMRLTTGWGLNQDMPDAKSLQDEVKKATPRTSWELSRRMEADSLLAYQARIEREERIKEIAREKGVSLEEAEKIMIESEETVGEPS